MLAAAFNQSLTDLCRCIPPPVAEAMPSKLFAGLFEPPVAYKLAAIISHNETVVQSSLVASTYGCCAPL